MAKRKHSTALFEVINHAKGLNRSDRSSYGRAVSMASPASTAVAPPSRSIFSGNRASPLISRWWFKRSSATTVQRQVGLDESHGGSTTDIIEAVSQKPALKPVENPMRYSAAPPILEVRAAASESAPAALLSFPTAEPVMEHSEISRPSADPRTAAAAHEAAGAFVLPPRAQNLAVSVDADRKQIALRMSFTTAIIGGFAVLVAIVLLIVSVQHLPALLKHHDTSSTALGSIPTDLLRKGPVQPGVLDVHNGTREWNVEKAGDKHVPAIRTPTNSRMTSPGAPIDRQPERTFNEPKPPATLISRDANRAANMNYVVVQSYAATEEKTAQDFCDYLTCGGVPCTIEKGLRGWQGRLVVVGIDGFTRLSAPEYRDYVANIVKVAGQYPAMKNVRGIQPSAYKWGKTG